MRSIRVFDIDQWREACEQAESMRGSDKPVNECIQFGRLWAKPEVGLAKARRAYEATRAIRERRQEPEEPNFEEDVGRLMKEPPAGTRVIRGIKV